jgi:hypothetical protein
MNRKRFINSLKKSFSLRLHMTAILLATSLAGVIASKGLLILGMNNVAVRYPVTVIFAYGVFFLAIKTWLWIISDPRSPDMSDAGITDLNLSSVPMPSGSGNGTSFGAGGSFDGGGATRDFGEPTEEISDVGGALSGVGDTVGDVVGGVADDEGGFVVVIVLGFLALLLFSVLGAGMFLVWQAPAILAEAAFDAILAASLLRSSKRINQPDWMGSVFRATWKPFATVFLISILAGWAMHHYLPEAARMLDVIRILM